MPILVVSKIFPKARNLESLLNDVLCLSLRVSKMPVRTKCLVAFVLFLALISYHAGPAASTQNTPLVYGRVADAKTGLPISGAHVVFWDAETLETPTPGNGSYLADKDGEYTVLGSYLKAGRTYYVYAFQGDFEAKTVSYVPSNRKTITLGPQPENVSFSLFPGALVEWEGTAYLVQASSPETRRTTIKVLSSPGVENSSMSQYGDVADRYYIINLGSRVAVIPADTPVVLEAQVWYYTRESSQLISVGSDIFRIYNNSLPFLLHQGNSTSFEIPRYSLGRGVDFAESRYVDISSQLDRAQSIGFVVFDERRNATQAYRDIIKAGTSLSNAQTDAEFQDVWKTIRDALTRFDVISAELDNNRLVSKTQAVYLSAVMAAFSAVLAFFLFEENRKKFYSNIAIYVAFLVALYFIYPGTHIIIDENFVLFLQSALLSFVAITVVVFGIPRMWKERVIEGEVSWRSAITVLFSMGKREIWRRRIRGFFTLMSIVVLVLAFVSLTSFGSVYGIVSDKLSVTAPANGVMVKRIMNATTPLLFNQLGFNDSTILSQWANISNVAERFKNIPGSYPVVRLVNKSGASWVIYGVMGVTPSTENMYTSLNKTLEAGRYLSDNVSDEVLLTANVATRLGVKPGQNLTLDVLGTGISRQVTVVGLINDTRYMNLEDMDGNLFGPIRIFQGQARRCNNTEIILTNTVTAKNIQRLVDAKYGLGAIQFVVLSDFVFQPVGGIDMGLIRKLIYVFDYDVLVSTNGAVTYYHIGSYFEMSGAAELLIPLIMVGLNVGMVMMNAVYERRKEIRTLSMLGLNPTHIGLMFVAEAVILGMVGGSLGYLAGLGFSRVMVFFGQELTVREKLEWWWSAAGFALAMAASVISSIRPAALAVSTYTPSMVKKVKRTEKETKARREEIFKVYQGRQLSMPVKVLTSEKEFFISFFIDRLAELKTGFVERVENIVQVPETEDVRGELTLAINFNYSFGATGRERGTKNSLVMTKSPDEDYYRVRLTSEPAVQGLPESAIERTIDFVHETCLMWVKDKERYLGTPSS
jgi:ABC-type lipoprotein release transport system permease subunit